MDKIHALEMLRDTDLRKIYEERRGYPAEFVADVLEMAGEELGFSKLFEGDNSKKYSVIGQKGEDAVTDEMLEEASAEEVGMIFKLLRRMYNNPISYDDMTEASKDYLDAWDKKIRHILDVWIQKLKYKND